MLIPWRVVQKKKPKPHEDLSIDEHHEEATKAAEAPKNTRQEISFSNLLTLWFLGGMNIGLGTNEIAQDLFYYLETYEIIYI